MKVDVAIITALDKEFDAVIRQGSGSYGMKWEIIESPRTSRTYYIAKTKTGTRIAVVRTSGMGQVKAAAVTSDILIDCFPSIILLVGIAAGVSNSIKLGDIAISKRIIDFESGKQTDEKTVYDYPDYNCNPALVRALTLQDIKRPWMSHVKIKCPDSTLEATPTVYVGDIFCSNKVVADSDKAKSLTGTFRKGIALEMEAFGVAAVIEERKPEPHFVMIKSICDKADNHKNDEWQLYASEIAATYTLYILNQKSLNKFAIDPFQYSVDVYLHNILNSLLPSFKDIEDFQQDLVKKILDTSLKEIIEILNGKYSVNMGYGGHYLSRAAPLFGHATSIFATSLDTISTFWTDNYNRAETLEYLSHQAPHGVAMRLFVFSNADNAHMYAQMLDKHMNGYDNVFICSKEIYYKFLDKIAVGTSVEELIKFDFSILQYKNQKVTTNLYAKLSSKSLTYHIIDINKPDAIDFNNFIEYMKEFSQVSPGSFHETFGIFRWQQGIWRDKEKWSKILKKMFDERNASVFHIVTFYIDDKIEKQLQRACANVKKEIIKNGNRNKPSLKTKYGIKEIRFGRQIKYTQNVYDGEFNGKLVVADEKKDPYILLMQFESFDGLLRFYSDNEHSKIRRIIYESLDSRISNLYEIADESSSHQDNKKQKLYFECIEAMASKHLIRRDYRDDELIQEMVNTTEPYQF